MWLTLLIIIAVIILIMVAFIVIKIKESSWDNYINEDVVSSYNRYITKQYFFSYSEKEFYMNLKKILFENYGDKYEIFPKVRLADIFEPKREGQWYKKIWMRHVDFLITDSKQSYKPVLAIELDWEYHKQYRQYKSDQFKNEVFKECNLPLIRFNNSTSSKVDIIRMNVTQYLWNN